MGNLGKMSYSFQLFGFGISHDAKEILHLGLSRKGIITVGQERKERHDNAPHLYTASNGDGGRLISKLVKRGKNTINCKNWMKRGKHGSNENQWACPPGRMRPGDIMRTDFTKTETKEALEGAERREMEQTKVSRTQEGGI